MPIRQLRCARCRRWVNARTEMRRGSALCVWCEAAVGAEWKAPERRKAGRPPQSGPKPKSQTKCLQCGRMFRSEHGQRFGRCGDCKGLDRNIASWDTWGGVAG